MSNVELGSETRFLPFYERLPERFPIPFIVKVGIAVIVGFLFLIPRYVAVQDAIVEDWSWLLCLIIITALVCLYYATHTFRSMFQQLNLRLRDEDRQFPACLEGLSDRHFVVGGVLFAALNCGVAWFLGPPSDGFAAAVTHYLGFVVAGFACGMPVAGIRGVVITLTDYLDREPRVDYTNPDGCGGLLFLGEALIKFSAVTLVVGVLIAIYILEFGWSRDADGFSLLVRGAMWVWIAIPFLLSLTILLAPASRANRVLMNHKIAKEVDLSIALREARKDLRQAQTTAQTPPHEAEEGAEEGSASPRTAPEPAAPDLRESLRLEIDYLEKQRTQLHRMRTWPLDARTNISFVFLFITNAVVAFKSIEGLITGEGG